VGPPSDAGAARHQCINSTYVADSTRKASHAREMRNSQVLRVIGLVDARRAAARLQRRAPVRLYRDHVGRMKISLGFPAGVAPVVAGVRAQVLDSRGRSYPRGPRAAAVGSGGARCARTILTQIGQGLTRHRFVEERLAEWLPPMWNCDEGSVTDKTAHAAHKLTGRATRPFAPCTWGRRLFSSDHG
jgi:hypothetical protein